MTFEFTYHAMDRYDERVRPYYEEVNPTLMLMYAVKNGYHLSELDKETQNNLSYIRRNSRGGNTFIIYRSFAFVFRYIPYLDTYRLITIFEIPIKWRFQYHDYTKR